MVRAEANTVHSVTVELPLKPAHSEYACGTEIQKTWKQGGFQSATFLSTSSQLANLLFVQTLTSILCVNWRPISSRGARPGKSMIQELHSKQGRRNSLLILPIWTCGMVLICDPHPPLEVTTDVSTIVKFSCWATSWLRLVETMA